MNNTTIKETILEVFSQIACGSTGSRQINFQSESAREMIASKLEPAIQDFIKLQVADAIEEVICCRGDHHG